MNDKPDEFDEDAFLRAVRRDAQIDFHYPTDQDARRTIYDVLILLCILVAVLGGAAFLWLTW